MTSASSSCCLWWAATLQSPSLSAAILCFSITKTFLIQEFTIKVPSSSLQNQLLLTLKKWLGRFLDLCMCKCRSEVNLRYPPLRNTVHLSWGRVSHWPGAYQGRGWRAIGCQGCSLAHSPSLGLQVYNPTPSTCAWVLGIELQSSHFTIKYIYLFHIFPTI